MKIFLPDTNVLVDYGRNAKVRTAIDAASDKGATFMIAPPTLTELSVGVVKGGGIHFDSNRKIFTWLQKHLNAILELPKPFMVQVLHSPAKLGEVKTHHQVERINLVADAASFSEFLLHKDAPGSAWTDLDKAVEIHDMVLDKEFNSLKKLAELPRNSFDVAAKFCTTFDPPRPNPAVFRERFSAAIEYAETTIERIRNGANPRKNDPGRFGDFQLFFYLADPKICLLTQEDFSSDITKSPQRTRIVGLDFLDHI